MPRQFVTDEVGEQLEGAAVGAVEIGEDDERRRR